MIPNSRWTSKREEPLMNYMKMQQLLLSCWHRQYPQTNLLQSDSIMCFYLSTSSGLILLSTDSMVTCWQIYFLLEMHCLESFKFFSVVRIYRFVLSFKQLFRIDPNSGSIFIEVDDFKGITLCKPSSSMYLLLEQDAFFCFLQTLTINSLPNFISCTINTVTYLLECSFLEYLLTFLRVKVM